MKHGVHTASVISTVSVAQLLHQLWQTVIFTAANIHWLDFVKKVDVCCLTEQPPHSSAIRSRRLSLFGHVAHMNVTGDANQLLFEPIPELTRRLYLAQEYLS